MDKLTFDDWKEKSDRINSLLETMTKEPTLSTWFYLYEVTESEKEKDEVKTERAKALIENLSKIAEEVKKRIDEVKVYWEDPEYIQLFKEVDEEQGANITPRLPNIWEAWLSTEQNGLKELQELYKKAFGDDK